jgi:oligopeptide/dipeptide ABC transporter ATP-binding protein
MTIRERVNGLLSQVALEPAVAHAFPHELSGGVRQRVALAAALSVEPRFIFCDEPVSVLDASARAQVLNLMQDVQAERGLTLLIVSHDLTAVEYVCHEVAVMYLGAVVEHAPADVIFEAAAHPYTEALMASMPERALDPDYSGEISLEGEIPSPINLPRGCRFHTRCPKRIGAICVETPPELLEVQPVHSVACHLYRPGSASSQL